MYILYFERGISKCFIICLVFWNDFGNWFGFGSVVLWFCKILEIVFLDILWFIVKIYRCLVIDFKMVVLDFLNRGDWSLGFL